MTAQQIVNTPEIKLPDLSRLSAAEARKWELRTDSDGLWAAINPFTGCAVDWNVGLGKALNSARICAEHDRKNVAHPCNSAAVSAGTMREPFYVVVNQKTGEQRNY